MSDRLECAAPTLHEIGACGCSASSALEIVHDLDRVEVYASDVRYHALWPEIAEAGRAVLGDVADQDWLLSALEPQQIPGIDQPVFPALAQEDGERARDDTAAQDADRGRHLLAPHGADVGERVEQDLLEDLERLLLGGTVDPSGRDVGLSGLAAQENARSSNPGAAVRQNDTASDQLGVVRVDDLPSDRVAPAGGELERGGGSVETFDLGDLSDRGDVWNSGKDFGHAPTVRVEVPGVKHEVTWSDYAAELEARGWSADPDAHGLWCPADCACGFTLPEDVAEVNPLLDLTRRILDPQVAAMFLDADDAETMRGSLHAFLRGAWRGLEPGVLFEDGPAIEAVCNHVQWQLEEWAISVGLEPRPAWWSRHRAQNLLIRIPPRSLKTVIVTIAACAWAWLRWPTMTIMSLSSNPRVTADGSDKVRDLIRSTWYQQTFRPTWRLREDRDSLAHLANTAGGYRKARGIQSRVLGEGVDWRIVDDPHDGDEVFSKAKREATHSKWEKALVNRFRDPRWSIVTGVMQALHWDDWGERRIRDGWPLLMIGMEFDPSENSRRQVGKRVVGHDGERVSPYGWRDWRTTPGERVAIRWTDEKIAELKLNPLVWSAQYQQRPTVDGGNMIKLESLCTYAELPSNLDAGWAISVDAAFKKNMAATGSRVSVQVWARKGPDRFLVDNVTRGMHLEETIDVILELRGKYPRVTTVLIEDKANGSEIIRRLREKISGVVEVNPGSDSKESRLMACLSYFFGRNIYLPEYAPWLEDLKAEWSQFPNWPRDDQVDAAVQLLLHWRMSSAAVRAKAGCQL